MSPENNGATAWLLLGSNIGDREAHLHSATKALGSHYRLLEASAIYETDAWGDRRQDAYLNQIVRFSVTDAPEELHRVTRDIERQMGRTEKGNFRPRKIDIDILFYGLRGEVIVDTPSLVIPHPKIQLRRFVLEPMAALDDELVHPVFGKSIAEMLEECEDGLEVRVYG